MGKYLCLILRRLVFILVRVPMLSPMAVVCGSVALDIFHFPVSFIFSMPYIMCDGVDGKQVMGHELMKQNYTVILCYWNRFYFSWYVYDRASRSEWRAGNVSIQIRRIEDRINLKPIASLFDMKGLPHNHLYECSDCVEFQILSILLKSVFCLLENSVAFPFAYMENLFVPWVDQSIHIKYTHASFTLCLNVILFYCKRRNIRI